MLIDFSNEACNNIAVSYLKVGYESMSVIRFWTMVKGNLPHLSYIIRNPYPLGTEFKTIACCVTGALIFIELNIVKEGIKHRNSQQKLGATTACTKRMMEATKGLGQRDIKYTTKDCFIFDNLLSSNKLVESAMKVDGRLLLLATSKMRGRLSLLLLQKTQGAQKQFLPIYLSTLSSFLMLTFALLLVPLSCISYLGLLMRLTLTKNQGILIWC